MTCVHVEYMAMWFVWMHVQSLSKVTTHQTSAMPYKEFNFEFFISLSCDNLVARLITCDMVDTVLKTSLSQVCDMVVTWLPQYYVNNAVPTLFFYIGCDSIK